MSEQKIIIGNSLDVLKGMPDESVDVCVTSPPYWALRDYGTDPVVWGDNCEHEWYDHKESARGGVNANANVSINRDSDANNRGHPTVSQYCSKCGAWRGQLGLEPSPLEYIDHLMMIFDEVKRVLKPTGACWVNLGDTYATVSGSAFQTDRKAINRVKESMEPVNELRKGLKGTQFREKSLVQIPSRFAIAMADHGWILRNEIIWYKPSAMPSAVKDRFTVDFEKFFFFTKQPKYYFKQQFEEISQDSISRAKRAKHNTFDTKNVIRGTNAYDVQHNDPNWQRWADPKGRNCRTTWSISNTGSNLEHVAMFPKELIKRPIDACCPEGGVVLDPFCGSGTTLEYCYEKDIDAIGIEINPSYEKMIKERANHGQTRLF